MTPNRLIQRVPRNHAGPATARLFCFGHAGAGAATFQRLQRLMPPTVEACAIRLPGRESRAKEPPLTSMDDVMAALISGLAGETGIRYALLGQCMGGLVAFELSRRLEARQLRPPEHIFVVGQPAPPRAPGGTDPKAVEEFIQEVMTATVPEALRGQPGYLAKLADILRADYAVISDYHVGPDVRVDVPLSVLAGDDCADSLVRSMLGWSDLTTGGFAIKRLPGGALLTEAAPDRLAEEICRRWPTVRP